MKNTMTIKVIIGFIILGVIGFGIYSFSGMKESDLGSGSVVENNEDLSGQEMMEEKESTSSMEKSEGVMSGESSMTKPVFSGSVLAGTTASLLDFKKADYDKAVASGKLVLLYFYADWCPICRAEFPKMQSAFNKLGTDQIIGFRVNYKDDFTDSDEVSLAKQFGVAYQHTKVFVKNGVLVSKYPDSWEESRYISEINKRLQ